MNKLFEFHEYTDNMKAQISIFILKGNKDIWWEDIKRVRDIRKDELSWWEFKSILRNKYLSERYYDNKVK